MVDSILLIGQSNMAGRGFLTPENRISNPRIFKLVNCRWYPMFEPVNPDRDFAGANLAPTFALEYLKYTENNIGIIPAADGGTAIEEWQKGEPLYENAVFLAKMAMKISNLKAILWHQGESDTHSGRTAFYKERFIKMLDDMKTDLGRPDIKIYCGGLGEFLTNYPHGGDMTTKWCDINNILMEIASEREDVEFVPADGLGANPDNLHFNTEALREFGRRYFTAYLKDHPEMIKSEEISAEDEYTEAKLEEMKKKLANGKISQNEYDDFFSKYIQTL